MNEFYNLNLSDPDGKRSWKEDFTHENGNYLLRCASCGELFLGHKRRFTCKMCNDHPLSPEEKQAANLKIKKSWQDTFERLKSSIENDHRTT